MLLQCLYLCANKRHYSYVWNVWEEPWQAPGANRGIAATQSVLRPVGMLSRCHTGCLTKQYYDEGTIEGKMEEWEKSAKRDVVTMSVVVFTLSSIKLIDWLIDWRYLYENSTRSRVVRPCICEARKFKKNEQEAHRFVVYYYHLVLFYLCMLPFFGEWRLSVPD